MKQVALDMAKRGFRVLPCNPGSKIASLDDWPNASLDALGVAEQWPGEAYNVAVHCKGLAVLDVDVKNGRNGLADLKTLPAIPDTYTVKTPSGGYHLYFRTPDGVEVSNSAKNLPAGLDIRGASGYVLAPGSVIDGKKYEVARAAPVAPAPEWLLERLLAAPDGKAEPGSTIGALDTPAAVDRAKAIIAKAPPAIEGERGNDTTYRLAAAVLAIGVSVDTAFDLLQPWNEQCSPPWDDADLQQIITNASTYKQEAAGYDNPLHGMEPVPAPPPAVDVFGVSADRWQGREPASPRFLIEHLIPLRYVTLIASAGGRGKSTLCLQLMACVASGEQDFLGYRVLERGEAAGIFAEDDDDVLHWRQKSICRALKLDFATIAPRMWPASYVGRDATLWKKEGPTDLLKGLEAAVAAKPGLKLLVLDGVAHLFASNEIDRGEVTRFMSRLTAIAARHDLAVVLLHHESKSSADDDTHAVSGSTAWINAARSVLKIAADGESDLRTIKHIKTNLGRKQPDIPCKIVDGAFVAVGGDRERAAQCLAATVVAMTSAIRRGERLSPKNRADNYAAKILGNRNPGFSKSEYASALAALEAEGTLRTEEYKSGGKTSHRYALAADGSGTVPVRTVPVRFEPEPPACKKRPKTKDNSKADGSSVRTVQ